MRDGFHRARGRRRGAGLLLLLVLLAAPGAWAEVVLQVDRDRIVLGETVTLSFVTDDPRQSLEADFGALDEAFEVLDRRIETHMSIVNGQSTALRRLLLTVEPRSAGTLTVPALDFGGQRTAPVTLEVEPAPELAPGELPPVFIEVELSPEQGPWYVHAQFGLVVRLFYQQNLTEAAISQPQPSPGSVRLLQETGYSAERGGEQYKVLERVYAIFPERSGELVIPALELSGRLSERGTRGIWQPAGPGRRIRVTSESLTLDIAPRPDGYTGRDWLPARELTLAQQISAADTLRVGEPVTRTVLIDAVGLEENMLVEPAWPDLPDARLYPDRPQGITRDDGRWVLGHKEFRYAVVPEREGELVLPELRVDWWDTVNGVQRTAVLPAHAVTVQPSSLVPPPAIPSVPAATGAELPPTATIAAGGSRLWPGLAALFAVLWLATTVLWWRARRTRGAARVAAVAEPGDEPLAGLKRACKAGDRIAARRSLRAWLRLPGAPAGATLLDFAAAVDDAELRAAVYALDAAGFRSGDETDWDGPAFWQRFAAWRQRQAQAGAEPPALTDLYARAGAGPSGKAS